MPSVNLTDRDREVLAEALDARADVLWDGAQTPAEAQWLADLAEAMGRLGLDSIADHWRAKAEVLADEFGDMAARSTDA